MTQVLTFEGYQPVPRYDGIPWTEVQIEEADTDIGPWTVIDTITLDPVDADPSDPAVRSVTTENASDTPSLWYRLVFVDATSDLSQPSLPVQNVPTEAPFATSHELFRILKIRIPTDDQKAAADRVLFAAAGEIRAEINLTATDELENWELALCSQVNLDRAADLWRHTESIPGMLTTLDDIGGSPQPARYSWERYAQRLAPIKRSWGLA